MKKIKNYLIPAFIILLTVLIRLFPHAPNFTPLGGMALFSGAYLGRKRSIMVIFLTLILSDYLLLYVNPFSSKFMDFSRLYSPFSLIHSTTLYVYGSFLLISLIGAWVGKHKSFRNLVMACLGSSVLFFLLTNSGVWAQGAYARDLSGLWTSYIMGLPFFRNTLTGDLFYTGIFFGLFEMTKAIIYTKTYFKN